MIERTTACLLCDRTDEVEFGPVGGRDAAVCVCPTCGRYVFTWEAQQMLKQEKVKPLRFILSALTRRTSDRKDRLELLTHSITELLETTKPPKTPYDVLDPLLLTLHDALVDPIGYAGVDYTDYPLFMLRSAQHLNQYVQLLASLGFVTHTDDAKKQRHFVKLTLKGWERVAQLRQAGRSSNRAFVAMSFASELADAYDAGIAPALTEAGWTPIRVDRTEHNDRIDDRIVAEIRRSGMLVADFTGHRQGVYFEAGLGLGIGIPVIWTVKESDLANVHFDTRQYNHIVWQNPEELRERLLARVRATVGAPVSSTASQG